MKLMVNGREVSDSLPADATLVDALTSIEKAHVTDDMVIAAVTVDGEPLTAERLSIWKDRPATDFTEANIELKSRKTFAASALRLIAGGLQESTRDRDQIAELLSQGQSQQALELLTGYIQTWNAVQLNLDSASDPLAAQVEAVTTHPNIQVLTEAQVEELGGYVGNFTVGVRQQASKATRQQGERLATSSRGDSLTFDVGAIIVATGYDLYPKEKLGPYGGGKYPDVMDGLQFERLLAPDGPTGGQIRRAVQSVDPLYIAAQEKPNV